MTDKEFNEKVAYNQTTSSWVIDIIATIIWFPMIIVAIIRRLRYRRPRTIFYDVESTTDFTYNLEKQSDNIEDIKNE